MVVEYEIFFFLVLPNCLIFKVGAQRRGPFGNHTRGRLWRGSRFKVSREYRMRTEVKSQVKEQEHFDCRPLQTNLRVENCLANYVDANALNLRNSVCFKCNQGAEIRAAYANS